MPWIQAHHEAVLCNNVRYHRTFHQLYQRLVNSYHLWIHWWQWININIITIILEQARLDIRQALIDINVQHVKKLSQGLAHSRFIPTHILERSHSNANMMVAVSISVSEATWRGTRRVVMVWNLWAAMKAVLDQARESCLQRISGLGMGN